MIDRNDLYFWFGLIGFNYAAARIAWFIVMGGSGWGAWVMFVANLGVAVLATYLLKVVIDIFRLDAEIERLEREQERLEVRGRVLERINRQVSRRMAEDFEREVFWDKHKGDNPFTGDGN